MTTEQQSIFHHIYFPLSFSKNLLTLRNTCSVNVEWHRGISVTKMNRNDNRHRHTVHNKNHSSFHSFGVKWKEKPKIESFSIENSLPFSRCVFSVFSVHNPLRFPIFCSVTRPFRVVSIPFFLLFGIMVFFSRSLSSLFMNFLAKLYWIDAVAMVTMVTASVVEILCLGKTMPTHNAHFFLRTKREMLRRQHDASTNGNMKNKQKYVYE